MTRQPLGWRGVYTTYRFCQHGRIWSAWRACCYAWANQSKDERPQLRKGAPILKTLKAPASYR